MNITMKAIEDVSVFRFNGFLNYESIARVRSVFSGKTKDDNKLVFNLSELNFVGSVGITDFIEVIIQISAESAKGVALCGVSSEFQRIISAKNSSIAFFYNEDQAVKSFYGMNLNASQTFLESEDLLETDSGENES